MAEKQNCKSNLVRLADQGIDCGVTMLCWFWFIFGFFFFFSWRYAAAALAATDREPRFQDLNNRFFRILFRILKLTAPRQKIHIHDEAAAIRSSVIVCNHLSYLDPLLLIALFKQHKTIVKTRFFSTPVFGWLVRKSGYLPATAEGRFSSIMIEQLEELGSFFQAGGNLFVFPEGTRSKDGKLGPLNSGAFKIARMHKVPIQVLKITNTNKLFTPGKFFFKTRTKNTIKVELIKTIQPDYAKTPPTASSLEQQVQQAFLEQQP